MNIDSQELKKFEAIAGHWWDAEGDFKTLHIINPIRLDYIDSCAALVGKKVLDVGCGGGLLSEAMAQRGAEVSGIDLGERAIEVAKLHLHISQLQVDYRVMDVTPLAQQSPQSYDVVSCMELLEHVPTPADLISDCAALTKPGGDVFFSTINRNPLSYGLSIVAAEYVLGLLARGTHDYQKFIKPSELSRVARHCGLRVCDISGIRYDPFGEKASLCDSVWVNYIVHCRKEA